MGRPVEHGPGEPLEAGNAGPVLDGQVRRDDDRTAFMSRGEDLEEKLGPGRRQRNIAPFVDNQELHRLEVTLQLQQPPLVAGIHQLMDEGRRGEGDGGGLLAGNEA